MYPLYPHLNLTCQPLRQESSIGIKNGPEPLRQQRPALTDSEKELRHG